jgi:long-subunit fatty acid transport protein
VRTLLIVLLAASDATAGGFGIPEVGVRRTGMATIVGRPDDASAIYHNPAGIVLQRGWNVYASLGFARLDVELEVRPWQDSDRFLGMTPGPDGYYAPARPERAFGVVPMLAATAELVPDRVVAGAAAYVGNATGASFDRDGVTRYHLVDGYIVAPQVVGSVAVRVNRRLALGATIGALYMRLHATREVFPVVAGTDVSGILGSRAQLSLDGSAWAPSWSIGAFGQPHPRVTWGATLTGRVDATLEGPIQVRYSADAADPTDVLVGTQRTEQLLVPWSLFAGASVDATPNVEVSAEARYWLYRQYDRQLTTVVGIALLREIEAVKDYEDSWALSAGVRVHGLRAAPRLDLMAGVQFDRSPAPSRTVTLDQPSFSHPAVHLGARWSTGRYRFGACYVHYWYLVPQIDDSITGPPSNMRGRGGNDIFTASIEAKL